MEKPPDRSEPSARPDGEGEYEFSAADDGAIRDLAAAMRFVGAAGVALGVASLALLVVGWFANSHAGRVAARVSPEQQFAEALLRNAVGIVSASAAIVIGLWVRAAGRHFADVAATHGRDVTHLMRALGELRRMFRFQQALIVGCLMVLGAVAALWGVIVVLR